MKRPIDSLVADIADDVSVDWRKLDEASQPDELVREFRIIAAIGAGRASETATWPGLQFVRALIVVAVVVGAVKIGLALLAATMAVPIRFGPRALFSLLFGASGALLFLVGRRDVRAAALAWVFVLIGSPFAQAYVIRARGGALDWPASLLAGITPEAFLPLGAWFFAWTFPGPPRSSLSVRIGRSGLMVAATLGIVLVLANVLVEFAQPDEPAVLQSTLRALDRSQDVRVFWPLLLLTGFLSLPYLVWKAAAGTVDERIRATWLPVSLLLGVAPIALAVIVSPAVPVLGQSGLREFVGIGLYVALASVIPSTAYLVLVQRVLVAHVAIRRAAQHVLVRRGVSVVTAVCVGYVAVSLWVGRERALADLLSEQAGLMSLTAIGFAGLVFRAQLLAAVDRWFERGAADYSQVMTRLASRLSGQRNIRDLHAALEQELIDTLQAAQVAIVVVNDDRSAFVSLEGTVSPLPTSAAIAGLFRSAREGLCLRGDSADQLARLLPRPDTEWLAAAGIEWVFPLFDSSESLIGLVGLGQGRGPAYSKRDRVLVSAMADQVALRMENLSLRHGAPRGGREGTRSPGAPIDWQNERAMQCPRCQRVRPADATVCDCGARLEPATLPLILNGKFKVERVLGAGGMSVVYLALDTDLNRRVAIKTMPNVTPRHVARLQREAQAMASVLHPNLAMIYGAERWRDVPLLVVEYLDGGTLLDGLRAGPMSVEDAVDLGILLADALDRMHAGGLLHRDIKPSNIGYTADGLPKLLDFGLAAMLDRVNVAVASVAVASDADSAGAVLGTWSQTATHTQTQHLVGTPLYLSPEALGGQEPDQSFDLWSLGVVLYEAVAGRHPFSGYPTVEVMRRTRSVRVPDVRDFRGDCPPALAAFLNDALSLSPERRPATAADFRMQLQSIRRGIAAGTHHALPPLY